MKQWITEAGTKIVSVIGGRSNVFLISGKGVHILVDTGPGFMKNKLILNLKSHCTDRPDFLILTHTHFDHAANAGIIKSLYNPGIIVHSAEAQFLKSGDSPLPAGTTLLTSWMIRNFGEKVAGLVKFRGVAPDLLIDKAMDLSDYGINVLILPTPGHTAGSISVIIDHEVALVGDALIGSFPGMCFPPFADNAEELLESWKLLLNSGCRLFLPSHGSSRTRKQLERNLRKRLKKSL